MKIAIVMPLATQSGGAEMMLIHLVQYGMKVGVEWHVLFLEDGPMVAQCLAFGATCTIVDSGRLRQPIRVISCIRQLSRYFRDCRIDVVVGWMTKAQLYAGPAALLAGVPVVWYQLGFPTPGLNLDSLATKIRACGVLTCSAAGAAAQERLRPSRATRVVWPGAELHRFDSAGLASPAQCRVQLGLPTTGFMIGIAGRLQRWKGMHVVVDAVALLRDRYPDICCVIVGGPHSLEPSYSEELDAQVSRLGLTKHVILAGFQVNVPEWMQAMDVVIHASDREPFGLVVIEAMALGKPVVAGDSAGPTEVITDGVNGLLAPYGNAAMLAKQVGRYLDDPLFAKSVAAAAKARAAEFSVERYVNRFIDSVKELMEQ